MSPKKTKAIGMPAGVPPPSLPLSFFALACAGMIGCGVALITAHSAAVRDPTQDGVVCAAHLAMLATLSMGVLGAMHQFVPVVTGKALRSLVLSKITLLTWLGASWLLPLGIGTEHPLVVECGGALASVAIVCLVVNLIPPLSVRGKGVPVTGLRLSVSAFIVTACFGVLYVGDRKANWFTLSGHIVLAHALIGLFGWLGLTYVAVAEKLWPMFFLAHNEKKTQPVRLGIWAIAIGLALLAPGLLIGQQILAWAGSVLIVIGLSTHLHSLSVHIRGRNRRVDLYAVSVITSALWLVVGIGFALSAYLTIDKNHHLGVALVGASISAFAGWLLEALVGHAQKVVPFIVWSAMRQRGIEKVPSGKQLLFADLYSHRVASITFFSITIAVASLCYGFAFSNSPAVIVCGGLLIVSGLLIFGNFVFTPVKLIRLNRSVPPKRTIALIAQPD